MKAGVVSAGDELKTVSPVPVLSVSAVAKLAELNEPRDVTLPDEIIAPVKLVLDAVFDRSESHFCQGPVKSPEPSVICVRNGAGIAVNLTPALYRHARQSGRFWYSYYLPPGIPYLLPCLIAAR